MDRRCFITGAAGMVALAGLAGSAAFFLDDGFPGSGPGTLQSQLLVMADPRFAVYASSRGEPQLFSSLTGKGIISVRDGVQHEKLVALARKEPLVEYQGFYYTQTELELYALAFLVSRELGV